MMSIGCAVTMQEAKLCSGVRLTRQFGDHRIQLSNVKINLNHPTYCTLWYKIKDTTE
jgi:hypothetical protein